MLRGLEASGAWHSKLCQCLEQRGSCRMILRLRALRINNYRGRHACRELHMSELLAHFIRQRLGRGASGALRARTRRTTAALLLIPARSFFAQRANGKAHEGHDDCKNNGGGKIHGKHGTSSVRLRMLRGMRDILFNPNGFSRPEQTGASKMLVRRGARPASGPLSPIFTPPRQRWLQRQASLCRTWAWDGTAGTGWRPAPRARMRFRCRTRRRQAACRTGRS